MHAGPPKYFGLFVLKGALRVFINNALKIPDSVRVKKDCNDLSLIHTRTLQPLMD